MAINNNLLVWSKDLSKGFAAWSATTTITFPTDSTVGNAMVAQAVNSNSDGVVAIMDKPQMIAVNPGETYTASASFMSNHTGQIYIDFKCLDANKNEITTLGDYGTRSITYNTWYQISGTMTVPAGIAYIYTTYRFKNTTATYPSQLEIYQPKVEKGSVVTAYRPAGVEDPNLIRNGHFYKGTNYWTTNSQAALSLSIANDESLMITKAQNVAANHAYTMPTQALTLNQQYTLTVVAKSDLGFSGTLFYVGDSNGVSLGPVLNVSIPADKNNYETYTVTFTMPSSGSTGSQIVISSTNMTYLDNIYIQSMKLEQGPYSTEWTAAPEDVAIGIDRAVIATAQHTIFDWNDKVGLTASLASNLNMTQQYNPTNETFSPDWTSTNLVITASLYRQDSTTNIINDGHVQTIKWYRTSVIDGTSPVLIAADSTHVIGANTLTIKSNDLNNKSSMVISCEITYLDIVSGQTLLAKKDMAFSRVTNGAILTYANVYLPNGGSLTNGQAQAYTNNSDFYGRNYLKASGSTLSNTNYLLGNYYLPSGTTLKEGDTITVTIKGALGSDRTGFGIYNSGGMIQVVPTLNSSTNKGNNIFSVTGTWRTTYVDSGTGNTVTVPSTYISVYQFSSSGTSASTIEWIKLEKGSNVATSSARWSMAPEDYPVVDIGKNTNQWIFEEYDNTNALYPTTPTFDSIRSMNPVLQTAITDSASVVKNNTDRNYTGHLRTAVYSPTATVAPLSFTDNGEATIYVNNNKSYAGGRNFVPNSALEQSSNSVVLYNMNLDALLTPYIGQTVTVSFDAKPDADGDHYIDWYLRDNVATGNIAGYPMLNATHITGTTYQRYSQTFTVPSSVKGLTNGSFAVRTNPYVNGLPNGYTQSGSAYVRNVKLELGSTATPWTPAPEDGINLLFHTEETFTSSFSETSNQFTDMRNDLYNAFTRDGEGLVMEPHQTYTLSFNYSFANYISGIGFGLGTGKTIGGYDADTFAVAQSYDNYGGATGRVVYTFTYNADEFNIYKYLSFRPMRLSGRTAGTDMTTAITITNLKVEKGSNASPVWTAAPETFTKNTTLSLNKGWNTLDVLYPAGNGYDMGVWGVKVGGGDNLFAGTDFKSQYTNISPTNTTSKGTNTYVGSWGGYNGGITDPTHNYHAMVNNTTFGEPVYEFNESDGTRQWKGISQDVKAMITPLGSGDYTVSFDVFATEAGARIYGGFYYYQTGGTTQNFWGGQFNIPITNIGTWQRVSAKVSIDPTIDLTKSINFYVYGYNFTNTPVMYMKRPKLEFGYTTNTLWTYKISENANASLMSVALKQDASFAENYTNMIQSITAKAELTRASVVDTTNVSYQWYKQDSTVVTDQGGGVGWLKLISSSPEQGYNTNTLTIPSSAINIFAVYKCRILDMQVDSITYNTTFEGLVSVTNSILPITVQVDSAGAVLLNGQGEKTLTARLYQNNKEIDTLGTIYTYKWYRWLQDGTKDATWNNSTGYKTGKVLVINDADVDVKATFSVEVS